MNVFLFLFIFNVCEDAFFCRNKIKQEKNLLKWKKYFNELLKRAICTFVQFYNLIQSLAFLANWIE